MTSKTAEAALLVNARGVVVTAFGDVNEFFDGPLELPADVLELLHGCHVGRFHGEPGAEASQDEKISAWDNHVCSWRTVNEQPRHVRVSVQSPSDHPENAGSIAYVFGLRDITDEMAAVESSLDKDRVYMVGSLMSGLMHELQSPLSALSGYVQLLRGKVSDSADVRGDLSKVEREVQRTHQITQRILAFVRGGDLEHQAVDLRETIKDAVSLLHHTIKAERVDLSTHFATESPLVVGDDVLFTQIFVNLIHNAIKAIASQKQVSGPESGSNGEGRKSRGTIRIRVDASPGRVSAFVIDDGPGIDEDIAQRVFEPFFTTGPRGVGHGVGLSFCRQILDAFGGRMELLRDEPGRGLFSY